MMWGFSPKGHLGAVLSRSHNSLARRERLTEASAGEGDETLACKIRVGANVRGKMNHSIDVWKEQYYDYMDLMTADI